MIFRDMILECAAQKALNHQYSDLDIKTTTSSAVMVVSPNLIIIPDSDLSALAKLIIGSSGSNLEATKKRILEIIAKNRISQSVGSVVATMGTIDEKDAGNKIKTTFATMKATKGSNVIAEDTAKLAEVVHTLDSRSHLVPNPDLEVPTSSDGIDITGSEQISSTLLGMLSGSTSSHVRAAAFVRSTDLKRVLQNGNITVSSLYGEQVNFIVKTRDGMKKAYQIILEKAYAASKHAKDKHSRAASDATKSAIMRRAQATRVMDKVKYNAAVATSWADTAQAVLVDFDSNFHSMTAKQLEQTVGKLKLAQDSTNSALTHIVALSQQVLPQYKNAYSLFRERAVNASDDISSVVGRVKANLLGRNMSYDDFLAKVVRSASPKDWKGAAAFQETIRSSA